MRRLRALVLSGLVTSAIAVAQQNSGRFECESHTVAIDRLPDARLIPIHGPDNSGAQQILRADFSGFDAKYTIQSVHFVVFFTPEPAPNLSVPRGKLSVQALVTKHGSQEWSVLADEDGRNSLLRQGWYENSALADLVQVFSELAESYEEPNSSDDPQVTQSGRPQVRIQQAESKQPVFLLTFIRLASAGGHGDVETEEGMVLDLRTEPFTAPAAVGCIKNDFASEQHVDERISCAWSAKQQDYICRTNASYAHEWRFLLIAGKKLAVAKNGKSP
ncbi:MAG TPA: hypothetical protein VFO39_06555 [Candidatus Sulfotelmatobacter sp.]|nr:hypothetical protein [Candidatus Sulfotelmatobacter sp.]